MKNFFAKIMKKKSLSYDKLGILATISNGSEVIIHWNKINKIVLLDTFEEYSGYFLTEDYLSKTLYNDISIGCRQNIVKIRTGGAPSVKKNVSEPFSKNFGTTSIYYPIFIEYVDESGSKNLYANHYDNKKAEELINDITEHISEDKIHKKKKLEGFTPLFQL